MVTSQLAAISSRLTEIGDSFCAQRGHVSGGPSGVAAGGRAWVRGVYWGYAWRARGRWGVVAAQGDVVSAISAVAVVVAVASIGIEGVGGDEGV